MAVETLVPTAGSFDKLVIYACHKSSVKVFISLGLFALAFLANFHNKRRTCQKFSSMGTIANRSDCSVKLSRLPSLYRRIAGYEEGTISLVHSEVDSEPEEIQSFQI